MFQQFGIRESQLYNACFWSLKCHSGRHCWEVVCVHVSQCTCMCMLYCVSVFVLFCFFFCKVKCALMEITYRDSIKKGWCPSNFSGHWELRCWRPYFLSSAYLSPSLPLMFPNPLWESGSHSQQLGWLREAFCATWISNCCASVSPLTTWLSTSPVSYISYIKVWGSR